MLQQFVYQGDDYLYRDTKSGVLKRYKVTATGRPEGGRVEVRLTHRVWVGNMVELEQSRQTIVSTRMLSEWSLAQEELDRLSGEHEKAEAAAEIRLKADAKALRKGIKLMAKLEKHIGSDPDDIGPRWVRVDHFDPETGKAAATFTLDQRAIKKILEALDA